MGIKMKKIYILILFIILWGIIHSQNFYNINTINTIEIFFAEENWDEILEQLVAEGNEERLVGTAIINGVQFDSVGVRYKGNSSYHPNNVKNPLNIKLDHIIEDQEIDGYGTLKLANGFKDPSFVRETLSYEIAQNYMPASLSNYCSVSINDQAIGLYTSVQDVDKYFMRTHFINDDNARFKGELNGGAEIEIWGYLGPDSTDYMNCFEIESDTGWSELINFLDIFNNNTDAVEEVLNVDSHLWMLAFDILMVNLDAPINFGHNYYLFQDSDGRFCPILWDLNENFGGFANLIGGPPLDIYGMQHLDPFLNISHPNYPIINRILPDPTFQKIYIAHLKTLIEENFSNNLYLERALEIQQIIDTEVQADQNMFFSYNEFLNNVYNAVGGGPMQIVGITQLMETRIEYILDHEDFQGVPPEIFEISYEPENIEPGIFVNFTAEVNNADLVKLGFRQNYSPKFEKIQMFDDGEHNDGNADDGVYGIPVEAGFGNLEYYIFAENEEAVGFSPIRAEYEFYSIEINNVNNGDLVINEFLASNDTIVPDQDGEYDDWVELYNNSAEPISLNGYYLSDDPTEPTKWQFPDTTIFANDFLIIWTDNDEEQDGLHASFKLSASGESVILTNPEQEIIDEITFGAQTTDISTGRYPNGTGDFIEMTPSFNAENLDGITKIEEMEVAPNKIIQMNNFPNPFHSSTTISFSLNAENGEDAEIIIYNLKGQKIKKYSIFNNQYSIRWDGTNENNKLVNSGIYFYTLKYGDLKLQKKMLLIR